MLVRLTVVHHVTITGTVESAAMKQKISERTRAINGVKDGAHNLDVDPKRKINTRNRK